MKYFFGAAPRPQNEPQLSQAQAGEHLREWPQLAVRVVWLVRRLVLEDRENDDFEHASEVSALEHLFIGNHKLGASLEQGTLVSTHIHGCTHVQTSACLHMCLCTYIWLAIFTHVYTCTLAALAALTEFWPLTVLAQ